MNENQEERTGEVLARREGGVDYELGFREWGLVIGLVTVLRDG